KKRRARFPKSCQDCGSAKARSNPKAYAGEMKRRGAPVRARGRVPTSGEATDLRKKALERREERDFRRAARIAGARKRGAIRKLMQGE
ncbi:hypothetical protein HMPREF1986_02525, partial [Oribacterium sp. oral taxon 078 str. F0263]